MKDWQAVHNEFSQFGWVEVTARYFYGGIDPRVKLNQPPYDMDIMIVLDATKMAGALLETDEGVRHALFELSEQAIALANQNYRITRAPSLEITNELEWDRETRESKICMSGGRLSFSITDKT